MRARWFSLGILLVAIVVAAAWLRGQRAAPQTIALPDGSQLTLLRLTSGTNHICRYANGWKEFVYPLLPLKLRARLSARVMEWDSFNRNGIMAWFRRDRVDYLLSPFFGNGGGSPTMRLYLCAADENGLESPRQLTAHTAREIRSPRLPGGPGATGIQISGWEFADYPRRSRQFKIVVYCQTENTVSRLGEFRVSNRAWRKFPTWTAEPLPATRRTNGLEVTLTKLETGMSSVLSGPGFNIPARVFSHATFQFRANGRATEAWTVTRILARSASGETRSGNDQTAQWSEGKYTVDLWGGLWLEEPAWKLAVDLARTGDFPSEDLYGVMGVRMPQPGEMIDYRVQTNLHARTVEFLGVSGTKAVSPTDPGMAEYVLVHVRTPYPLDELRVVLAEVRDDRGRIAEPQGLTSTIGTGAGGNTPKESLFAFRVVIPAGAKSLDIKLAATPIRHVEFLAKPVMCSPPAKAAD